MTKKKVKKQKKPSFFRTVIKAIKEAKKSYDRQIREQMEKHRLLSSHSDWTMIENMVQQCNTNPDLIITIRLNDGATIRLSTYRRQEMSLDQRLNDITIEETF